MDGVSNRRRMAYVLRNNGTAEFRWLSFVLIQTLFVITGQCGGDEVRLSLPLHFTSFIGEAKGTWQKMFEHGCFNAARRHGSNTTLFIDSPGPVADIFYLLQILAPGMLLIVRVDERNDGDENDIRENRIWVIVDK